MSTLVDREVAKMTIDKEEIYVCIYVYQDMLLNLSYFQKTEDGFKELLYQDVSSEQAKEFIRRVRANEVEKVSPYDLKQFIQSLDKHDFLIRRKIKEMMNKTSRNTKVEHVGEVAGIHYLVSQVKETPIKPVYLLQKSNVEEGFEIGKIPSFLSEIVLLDYIHHFKIKEIPQYLMIDDKQIIGIKKSKKHSNIIHVVKIDVFPNSVSASKAYMVVKKNLYEYALLSFQESTPELMENLQTEGEEMVHQLMKILNLKEK